MSYDEVDIGPHPDGAGWAFVSVESWNFSPIDMYACGPNDEFRAWGPRNAVDRYTMTFAMGAGESVRLRIFNTGLAIRSTGSLQWCHDPACDRGR